MVSISATGEGRIRIGLKTKESEAFKSEDLDRDDVLGIIRGIPLMEAVAVGEKLRKMSNASGDERAGKTAVYLGASLLEAHTPQKLSESGIPTESIERMREAKKIVDDAGIDWFDKMVSDSTGAPTVEIAQEPESTPHKKVRISLPRDKKTGQNIAPKRVILRKKTTA
jgi:hypothetical protein